MEAILPQSHGCDRRRKCHNQGANVSKEEDGLREEICGLTLPDSDIQSCVNEAADASDSAGAPEINSNSATAIK